MSSIKYFFQFFIIKIFFLIFKVIGLRYASNVSSFFVSFFGPFFRSKKIIQSNILKAMPNLNEEEIDKISREMWSNYGRILSEYVFIKEFRNNNLKSNFDIEGQEILEKIKKDNETVIFISGHFNNFELMAMHLENSNINLAAVYRPLNNRFLNNIMESLRKNHICKNQIKKGLAGTKQLLSFFKKGSSIALMIDQRVSQGIKANFFNQKAFTTTIPAQFIKKFKCRVVPIYIERVKKFNFKLTIHQPIQYSENETIETITEDLNGHLEKMILKNPGQWIWSHNRWK